MGNLPVDSFRSGVLEYNDLRANLTTKTGRELSELLQKDYDQMEVGTLRTEYNNLKDKCADYAERYQILSVSGGHSFDDRFETEANVKKMLLTSVDGDSLRAESLALDLFGLNFHALGTSGGVDRDRKHVSQEDFMKGRSIESFGETLQNTVLGNESDVKNALQTELSAGSNISNKILVERQQRALIQYLWDRIPSGKIQKINILKNRNLGHFGNIVPSDLLHGASVGDIWEGLEASRQDAFVSEIKANKAEKQKEELADEASDVFTDFGDKVPFGAKIKIQGKEYVYNNAQGVRCRLRGVVVKDGLLEALNVYQERRKEAMEAHKSDKEKKETSVPDWVNAQIPLVEAALQVVNEGGVPKKDLYLKTLARPKKDKYGDLFYYVPLAKPLKRADGWMPELRIESDQTDTRVTLRPYRLSTYHLEFANMESATNYLRDNFEKVMKADPKGLREKNTFYEKQRADIEDSESSIAKPSRRARVARRATAPAAAPTAPRTRVAVSPTTDRETLNNLQSSTVVFIDQKIAFINKKLANPSTSAENQTSLQIELGKWKDRLKDAKQEIKDLQAKISGTATVVRPVAARATVPAAAPTAQPTSDVLPPTPPYKLSHTVTQQDTLQGIADMYESHVQWILDANPEISNWDDFGSLIDEKIHVPVVSIHKAPLVLFSSGGEIVPQAPSYKLPHTVTQQDTLLDIAEMYDSHVQWILDANSNIPRSGYLGGMIGGKIVIPIKNEAGEVEAPVEAAGTATVGKPVAISKKASAPQPVAAKPAAVAVPEPLETGLLNNFKEPPQVEAPDAARIKEFRRMFKDNSENWDADSSDEVVRERIKKIDDLVDKLGDNVCNFLAYFKPHMFSAQPIIGAKDESLAESYFIFEDPDFDKSLASFLKIKEASNLEAILEARKNGGEVPAAVMPATSFSVGGETTLSVDDIKVIGADDISFQTDVDSGVTDVPEEEKTTEEKIAEVLELFKNVKNRSDWEHIEATVEKYGLGTNKEAMRAFVQEDGYILVHSSHRNSESFVKSLTFGDGDGNTLNSFDEIRSYFTGISSIDPFAARVQRIVATLDRIVKKDKTWKSASSSVDPGAASNRILDIREDQANEGAEVSPQKDFEKALKAFDDMKGLESKKEAMKEVFAKLFELEGGAAVLNELGKGRFSTDNTITLSSIKERIDRDAFGELARELQSAFTMTAVGVLLPQWGVVSTKLTDLDELNDEAP